MANHLKTSLFCGTLILAVNSQLSWGAYPTWTGCDPLKDADFKMVRLVSRDAHAINEPIKMAFDLVAEPGEDAKGKVDIYFVERAGKVRRYDAKANKVVELGKLASGFNFVSNQSEGAVGIVLDPKFKTNRWVYIYYSFSQSGKSTWRISRFTLNAEKTALDMTAANVKLLLEITREESKHTGGAMAFDDYGDLWITTGDNSTDNATDPRAGSNTNDLRGKILRIRPNDDGTSYTVPTGNLFPPGTARAKPEIFIMGNRNPYSIALDPYRRWVMWGEIGPDDRENPNGTPALTEEHNFATAPGNYGYPFFSGANFAMDNSGIKASQPIMPTNITWGGGYERGRDTLPPAIPAIHAYAQDAAITGPFYRYNGDLNSSIKMPPHFNRKWFLTDFNKGIGNPIMLFTMSEDGKSIIRKDTLMKTMLPYKPLDFQAGPDGALYFLNYSGYRTVDENTSIARVEYTGTCLPDSPKLETTTAIKPMMAKGDAANKHLSVAGRQLSVKAAGSFTLVLRDLSGRVLHSWNGRDQGEFFASVRHGGLYILTLQSRQGLSSSRVLLD